MTANLMSVFWLQLVALAVEALEQGADGRMVDRLTFFIGNQVLLADIRDIARLRILGEQVIEGLVLVGAHRFGNGLIPFVAVGKLRIDVENHPAKIQQAVAYHFANAVAGSRDLLGNRYGRHMSNVVDPVALASG